MNMRPASEACDHGRLEFQDVYNEFHPKIRRYLDRLVGRTEAEDVIQDVFVKVRQALHLSESTSSLCWSAWRYRSAPPRRFGVF